MAGRVSVGGRGLLAGGAGQRQAGQGQGRQPVLLRFDKPAPAELLAQAAGLVAETIEPALAWEFAPEDEFGFADLARDYFSADATVRRSRPARCWRLFEAPHYFRRAGKGRFRKAPAEIVAQALAAIEKKKQVATQIARLGRRAGRRPLPGAGARAALPHPVPARQERPRVQGGGRGLARHPAGAAGPAAARRRHRVALPVPLAALSARPFPARAPGFPAWSGAAHHRRAAAGRRCRRIRSTTRRPPRSTTRSRCRAWAAARWCGHPHRRAGPGHHARQRHRPAGRQRLSTVYMPGYKITMLPDDVVQTYTLSEGATCRRCRSTWRWTRPRWRSRPPRPGWSACRSPPTCATTSSTA
jgi:exoribonuclease-2